MAHLGASVRLFSQSCEEAKDPPSGWTAARYPRLNKNRKKAKLTECRSSLSCSSTTPALCSCLAVLPTVPDWLSSSHEPTQSLLPSPSLLSSVLTHFFSGFSWCSLKTHITHRVTCCGLLSAARSEGKMADSHFRMQLRVTPTKAEVSFHTICSLLPLLPTL